ncbi:hypothetical protein [Streptomyces sp. NPDC054952]
MAGLIGAAELLQNPGAPRGGPDAVGITARVRADGTWIAWAGDCRAYGIDPDTGILTRYTTDHTVAAHYAQQGMPADEAAAYSSNLTVSFSDLSIAACNEAPIPNGHLVILTSDGVHDQMDPTVLDGLVHAHHNDAQALAVDGHVIPQGYDHVIPHTVIPTFRLGVRRPACLTAARTTDPSMATRIHMTAVAGSTNIGR